MDDQTSETNEPFYNPYGDKFSPLPDDMMKGVDQIETILRRMNFAQYFIYASPLSKEDFLIEKVLREQKEIAHEPLLFLSALPDVFIQGMVDMAQALPEQHKYSLIVRLNELLNYEQPGNLLIRLVSDTN